MKTTVRFIVILFILTLTGTSVSKGQQMPQLSQYMFNKYAVNPAVAGTFAHTKMKLGYRYQWIGFDNSVPHLINFSVHGPFEEKPMGWGASAYADIVGPTSKIGALGTYTYNIAINELYRLSMGASMGLLQYKLSGSQIDLGDDIYDKAFKGTDQAEIVPDGNIGVYFYSTSLYAGFAAHHLFGNRLNFFDVEGEDLKGLNRLTRHYYLSAGKLFMLNSEYRMEAYMLLKGAQSALQWELTAQVTYQNMVWGGLSYRHQDAMSVLVGGQVDNYIFGLSYDLLVTDIRPLTSGTIELMVGFNFDDMKK